MPADFASAKVAIYTRVSQDPTGEQTATLRQERACRSFALARDWDVADVYEDVDLSAYKPGVSRPAYEEMLRSVRDGRINGILVWKLDRLVRRPAEFERLWCACEHAGVFLASATEPIDSSTELGLAMVRILVTFAALESATTALRLRARNEHLAREGNRPACTRAFGFTSDWSRVVPGEAAVVREAARRILGGESVGTIARDFNTRTIRSPGGKVWTTGALTRLLRMPRLVGDRTYHGEVVARDCFPAILDRHEFARLSVVLARPGKPLQRHLLSGLAVCGLCGGRLYVFGIHGRRCYVCAKDNGCGRIAITAHLAEAAVAARVLKRLAQLPRSPIVRANDGGNDRMLDSLARRLSTLYNERRRGVIGQADYLAGRRSVEREVRLALPRDALDPVRSNETWQGLTLAQQHGVLVEVVERITVMPAIRRGTFDPNRLRLHWWANNGSMTKPATDGATIRRALLSARIARASKTQRWLSLPEVCGRIGGLTERSICQFVINGDLPAYRDGDVLRFRADDVNQFVQRSRVRPHRR